MSVGEDGRVYQVALEAARSRPDDDDLIRELDMARRALVISWLNAYAGPTAQS